MYAPERALRASTAGGSRALCRRWACCTHDQPNPTQPERRFDKAVPGPAASGAGMEAVRGLGEKVSALVEQYIAGVVPAVLLEGS